MPCSGAIRSAVRPDFDELLLPHSVDIRGYIVANINHDRTNAIGSTGDGKTVIRFGVAGYPL
jgi:hypothetical protein